MGKGRILQSVIKQCNRIKVVTVNRGQGGGRRGRASKKSSYKFTIKFTMQNIGRAAKVGKRPMEGGSG